MTSQGCVIIDLYSLKTAALLSSHEFNGLRYFNSRTLFVLVFYLSRFGRKRMIGRACNANEAKILSSSLLPLVNSLAVW